MKRSFYYSALFARQSDDYRVFVFCAPAQDVLTFATIDRIGRTREGELKGFQRPQVSSHIKEIRDYLANDDAVLPNSVVVAFTDGVEHHWGPGNTGNISIHIGDTAPGLVVDGQQRLFALGQLPGKEFEVFVTGIICKNSDALRRQFILINNTRPLPKSLIYELLPTVEGLPQRLSSRSTAALLIERLNYGEGSSLRGQIKQHTNPTGVIQDTVMQKMVMNSLSDGVLRELIREDDGISKSVQLISEFFCAIQFVFEKAWVGHKPRTSRLVHGAGIIAMGYVMEHLCSTIQARSRTEFEDGLNLLKGKTAWTAGIWEFGENNIRPWNSVQCVPRDYMELSQYLVRTVRRCQVLRAASHLSLIRGINK